MLLWILLLALLRGSVSLRLLSLEVPDKVARGQGTRLTCGYDLEGDVLYSIKWYRDDVEFFRYVPTDRPSGQFFPLQGIKVDLGKSSNGSVYIREISHLTAGTYKCEVSADAPSFQTVSAEQAMAVQDELEERYSTSSAESLSFSDYVTYPSSMIDYSPDYDYESSGGHAQQEADRISVNLLLLTMLLLLQWRNHLW